MLVGWSVFDGSGARLSRRRIAVLIIACPCAFGLATRWRCRWMGRGAEFGILMKGPEVLEQTRRIDRLSSTRPEPSRKGRMRARRCPPLDATRWDVSPCGCGRGGERASGRRAIAAAARCMGRRLPVVAASQSPESGAGSLDGHAAEMTRREGRPTSPGRRSPRRAVVRDTVKPTSADPGPRAEAARVSTPVLLTGDFDATAERVAGTSASSGPSRR